MEQTIDLPAGDWTATARQALGLAYEQAAALHASAVSPEHLLLGMLGTRGSEAVTTLTALHVDPHQVAQNVAAQLPSGVAVPGTTPPLSDDSKAVLRYAVKEASNLGQYPVSAVHMLLALLYDGHGPANAALTGAGLSLYELRQQLLQHPPQKVARPGAVGVTPLRPSLAFLGLIAIMVGTGVLLFRSPQVALVRWLTIAFVLSGWITSVCVHEFGHAITAYLGGDRSVRDKGYLTLNPLKYTHPVLSIVMPVVFLLLGGIGLPGGAVYINRAALRSSRWEILVSAAGPLGTALCGLLAALPFVLLQSGWITTGNIHFWAALAFLAFLEVTALFFNLIPIPPLDGFGIIEHWLPAGIRNGARQYSNFLFLGLFFMLWQGGPVTQAFWNDIFRVTTFLHIPGQFVFAVQQMFSLLRG
ncbi:MAG: hypothetical protein H0X37_20725 [Herpetosiphonaceae bacterium]|nr:hypothetical protein [Herpetosiphonaceae bacterium]